MKHWSILIGLLALTCSAEAKERVIERPSFIAWNSDVLEIDKIVQNDTATIVYTQAYFRPREWIRINDESFLLGNDGVKYQIRTTEGIPINKEFYMPESGEVHFQMIFPPLPETVSAVDFSEGDIPGGWNIWGIQLKSHNLPKLELPEGIVTTKPNKKTTLIDPVFTDGKATLKGKILDYQPGMNKTLGCTVASCIKVAPNYIELDISDDGTFYKEIPVVTTTPVFFYLNNQLIRSFLAPGEETIVYFSSRELSRAESRLRKTEKAGGKTVYYSGYMADISNELAEATKEIEVQNNFWQLILAAANKTTEELRAEYLKEKDQKSIEIDNLKISPASKVILKSDIMLATIERIHFIPATFSESYAITNQLTQEERLEYKPADLSKDFFDIGYKGFTEINSPLLVYSVNYSQVVDNPFIREKLISATGINKGFFFDLSEVGEVMQQISDFGPATPEQIKLVAEGSLPFLVPIIEKKNEELAKIIEANKKKSGFTVNELGEVVNEDLFASLIAQYKGKVILADFWATWCGPCRMANKAIKPLKEELLNKDVVFLYIAGENSPKGAWENMIPEIAGEHFRLKREQWEYLTTTFGVNGVPTYFVVDKEGQITYKQVGFPGIEKIKEELESVLY